MGLEKNTRTSSNASEWLVLRSSFTRADIKMEIKRGLGWACACSSLSRGHGSEPEQFYPLPTLKKSEEQRLVTLKNNSLRMHICIELNDTSCASRDDIDW